MSDRMKRLALVLCATAMSLLLMELLLRAFVGPAPRGNMTPIPGAIRMNSNLPGVPYLLRPGVEVAHVFPSNPDGFFDRDRSVTYRINSLGFRGRETTLAKPSYVFRIVGVGDSFTLGTGVRSEDTFLAGLERRLKAENSRQVYEVLNLGVMGFDTIEEVALLREQGVAYEPDLVIICFFLNDAKGGSRLNPLNVVSQRRGAVAALARNSYLLDRALWVVERRRQAEWIVRDYRRSFESSSAGWRAAQRALEEAAALADQKEFELVLMLFPVLWDLDDGYAYTEIHETVASFARGKGIPVLDLLPAFSDFEGPELWVHPTNQHPNAEAHEIAAAELFEFLRNEALIGAPATSRTL